MIRRCTPSDLQEMHAIVNDAAQAYKGVIPEDRWHEPYMPMEELEAEIRDGVEFWGLEEGGRLLGLMGIQDKGCVALIRHAYVRTPRWRGGIGTQLLKHLESLTSKPILIGTWQAASWAIRFYERNGYVHSVPRRDGPPAASVLEHSKAADRDVSGAGQSRIEDGKQPRAYSPSYSN